MKNVKQHTRKSKKGSLANVSQHERKGNKKAKIVKRIKNLHKDTITSAVKFIFPFKGKTVFKDDLLDYENQLKKTAIKFVIKNYKDFDKTQVKNKTNELLGKLQQSSYKVFRNKRLSITLLENKNRPIERTKSNFKYYFGSGNFIDDSTRTSGSIKHGDTFYSQKIKDDKTWKDTLGRKNLSVIQVSKPSAIEGKFNVIIININKGKLKETRKVFSKKEIFELIK